VTVHVKVIPRSRKNEVSGELADGTLKVHVTAPPEKGKANEQARSVLAGHYRVPVRAVQIVSGHSSPRKVVRIDPGRAEAPLAGRSLLRDAWVVGQFEFPLS
jgi:uncharacterized protein (TIGR00251 family)